MAKKEGSKTEATLPLVTQKDGRLYAVRLLQSLQKVDGDDACAFPYASHHWGAGENIEPFRKGPQWTGLRDDLFRLFREGSEAAQLGFCTIFTDALAGDGLTVEPDFYIELEQKDRLLDFGTPGTAYPIPIDARLPNDDRDAAPAPVAPRPAV